jgi:glycosyltransferase involved in cell wall biosynthesis
MKILYICNESLPSPYTNTEQLIHTLAELIKQPCTVDLICPKKVNQNKATTECKREIASFYGINHEVFDEGLNLIELPYSSYIRGKVRRPIHDIGSVMYGKAHRYDLVYTRDPFSLLLALAAGVQTVFETYRLDINTLSRYFLWRSFCYSRSNLLGIITHSKLAQQAFLSVGSSPSKVLVAYNGCSPLSSPTTKNRTQVRQDLRLPIDRKVILYAGHINPQKDVDIFLPLAKILENIQFVLVGGMSESSGLASFERKIVSQGISNIAIIPRVSPASVGNYFFAADCLIIPPSSKPLREGRRTVLPLKTFRYLAAGRAIVAPDLPDIREILKHKHNAVLVPPDSPKIAAQVIKKLLSDENLQEQISKNALLNSRRYTWEGRAARIFSFLQDLIKKKKHSHSSC